MGGLVDDNAMQMDYGYKTLFATQGSLGASGSLAQGTPVIAEISTFGYGAGAMTTADEFMWLLPVLGSDINWANDILARILFISSSAAADALIDWSAYCAGMAVDVLMVDPSAAADGTINFDAHTMTATADILTATEWRGFGVAGTFVSDMLVGFAAELTDDGEAAGDELHLVALQLKYTRTLEASDGVRKKT